MRAARMRCGGTSIEVCKWGCRRRRGVGGQVVWGPGLTNASGAGERRAPVRRAVRPGVLRLRLTASKYSTWVKEFPPTSPSLGYLDAISANTFRTDASGRLVFAP